MGAFGREAIYGAMLVPGWYSEERLKKLYMLAVSVLGKGDDAVEVGTWLGRSAYVLAYAAAMADARLTCIDTWKGLPQDPNDRRYELAGHTDILAQTKRNLAVFDDRVSYLQCTSAVGLALFAAQSTTFVHIDGDHSPPVVGEDVLSGWRTLRGGGILCGDDYDEPDVRTAVAQIGITPDVADGKLWWITKPTK